jgi:hypothetical protein
VSTLQGITRGRAFNHVIVPISPSSGTESNPVDTTDWSGVGSQQNIRECPKCLKETVIGHGWRSKQSHDEQYDWIKIRRGFCKQCSTSITFLPWLSLSYTHYSLRTRSECIVEGRPLDKATPTLKDPNRIPAGCTIRQWFGKLDSLQTLESLQEQMAKWPPATNTSSSIVPAQQRRSFQFLQKIVSAVSDRLAGSERLCYGDGRDQSILSWQTVAHFLHRVPPLRC